MRKYHYLPLILIFISGMVSCKKEDVPANTSNPLLRIVSKTGTDSIISEFSFDGAGRLAQDKTFYIDASGTDVQTLSIVRDASGKATRVVDAYAGSSNSTAVRDYIYNGNKVRHGLYSFDFLGIAVRDSIAYSYAARVSKVVHYYTLDGSDPAIASFSEYTWDGKGNMIKELVYSTENLGDPQLVATVTYTYDTNVNPYYANDDALVEYDLAQYISPNNVTRIGVDAVDPSESFEIVTTYEYGADKRPVKAVSVVDGTTYQMTFIYKK